MKVERLGPGDGRKLAALNDLFAEVFDMPTEYRGSRPDPAYVEELLADPAIVLLAGRIGDELAGALAAYELPKFEQARREYYIYDLAVRERFRRRGVATALIAETRRIARARGAWTVFIQANTEAEDQPAIALYRKLARSEEAALHFDIEP